MLHVVCVHFSCRGTSSFLSGAPVTQPGSDAHAAPSPRTQPSSVPRCQEERARLQAELEQKQREAERKDAAYEKELGGQRDLVRAMKSRVLELIQ